MKENWNTGNLDTLLLGILRQRAAHGYELIQKLKETSEAVFDLPEGTVYPSLHRLEKTGAISSSWDSSSGRRRRIYAITPNGRAALQSGKKAWAKYSHSVNMVLGMSS